MASGVKRKRLVIIDGKSIFYRGYFAMPFLSTKDGVSTGGVFGFASMALEIIRKLKPDYVCVAWDKPKTNIRKRLKIYPHYKAGRKPAPPDFNEQIPILHELLEAFGWPLYELDDYEADDIMGALAVQATAQDIETMLVTSDLDMLQLIDLHVCVYALKRGLSHIELYHPESFVEKYGLTPNQFLDLKALKGDSSDNIPGVPGIGEKGAIELLKQYGTLDNIYENIELIKDVTKKKLIAGKESAYMSKQLAAIWTDAPVKLNLSNLDGSKCDPARVRQILQKLEFKSLLRASSEIWNGDIAPQKEDPPKLIIGKNIIIKDINSLKKLVLPKSNELIIHSQLNKNDPFTPDVISISPNKDLVFVFDINTLGKENFSKKIKDYITQSPLVGYDLKSTLKCLLNLGINAKNIKHDLLVGSFLINSLRRDQSLEDLASEDLKIHLAYSDNRAVNEAETIAVIRALYEQQQKTLQTMPKLNKLAENIEWPIIPVLAQMEYAGIKLDTKYLETLSVELEDKIINLEQEIYGIANQQFNINSPLQLADVLFKNLKLPTEGIKKTKSGYSTAASELAKLHSRHKIIGYITQFREYTKLKNTYIDTLPKMVDKNSRLHTTFNLTIAQTGRLSSNDPNLQNIPVRTEIGKQIREAFVADVGKVFVSADYSQFELRLAAFLSKDKKMIEMFNRDVDIHTATASEIFGRNPEDVTKNMRRDAKIINFGILYGMSTHGLSVATGMSREQAESFIKKYFELREPLLAYLESLKKQAKEEGYVETLFGRRRPMPDIKSSNFMIRSTAERAAMNMPIQGTEADLMKMAMIQINKKLDKDCKQLLQIHDSILVECPENMSKSVAKLLQNIMQNIYKLPVKLTVDTSIGKTWGDL